VKEAPPAAQAGDGRAAFHLADVLAVCALTIHNYKGVADPEAKLQQELQGMAKADQWVRDNDERITRRCLGLAREEIPGLQSAKYWRKAALKDGDPLAQVDAARDALVSIQSNTSDEDKAAALKVARDNLRQVVESGDLEALWRTGHLLATPSYSTDSLQGMALALATCNLGRDCSAANPANASYMCKYSGACPPDADYAYFLQQSLGPDQ
jgi:hypothetical protein